MINNQKEATKTKFLNKIWDNALSKICYNKELLVKVARFNI